MRKLLCCAILITATFMMTGCVNTNPEKVVIKMSEKFDKESSYDMNIDYDLSIATDSSPVLGDKNSDINSSAEKVEMEAFGGITMTVNNEDEKNSEIRMNGISKVKSMGLETESPVLGYIEQKDGKFTSYMTDEKTGKWIKSEKSRFISVNELFDVIGENTENMAINKKTEKVGGQECHVLSGVLSGEELIKFISVFESSSTKALEVDAPELEFTLYVNKKTMLPVLFKMTNSPDDEANEMSIWTTIEFNNWGTAREVKIPGVAKEAMNSENASLEDVIVSGTSQ